MTRPHAVIVDDEPMYVVQRFVALTDGLVVDRWLIPGDDVAAKCADALRQVDPAALVTYKPLYRVGGPAMGESTDAY